MTIQVTRFSDGTLVAFAFNHLMGDIYSKNIMKGWESALAGNPITPWGRLEQVPFAAYGPGGKLPSKGVNSNSPALPAGWSLFGLVDKARFLSRLLGDDISEIRLHP